MGLGNNVFNELKRQIIELDNKENEIENDLQRGMQDQLKQLYEEKESLENESSNYNLAKMVVINDLERIKLMTVGNYHEAEKVARQNYSKKNQGIISKIVMQRNA